MQIGLANWEGLAALWEIVGVFFLSLLHHRVEQKTPVPADLPKDFRTAQCLCPNLLTLEACLKWCVMVPLGRSRDSLVVKSLGKGSRFSSKPCYRIFVILSVQVQAVSSPSPQGS